MEVLTLFDKEDRHLFLELKKHLTPLEREGLITLWDEDQIIGGTDRKEAIHRHLQSAALVLLLVSANFMASDTYTLAIQALAKHIPPQGYVVPVLLHEVDWEYSDFGRLTPLPTDGKPISSWANRPAAYLDIVRGIRKIVATYQQEQTQPHFSQPISVTKNSQKKEIGMSDSAKDQQTSTPKTLSLTQKLELVNTLLACTYISNRESRETVLGLLNEQFPGLANRISRRLDNQADVMEIVITCDKHPGSLRALCEIVISFEGSSSINTQNLRRFMQEHSL